MASSAQSILHEQRYLIAEAQFHLTAQSARLAEVDQVFQRERQCDRLAERDFNVLVGLFHVRVRAQCDGPRADVAGAGELDALFRAFNRDCQS